ncbi:MAG: adaptor protein MecA [Oscillospiraceae bacterium]|nr:adaptor protein MecA [Oscillospiraceae bacterium]
MEFNTFGNGNYFIHIPPSELDGAPNLGDLLGELTGETQFGEFDLFACGGGAIVLARRTAGCPVCVDFPDFESVIAAARVCGGEQTSFLASRGGGYSLLLYAEDVNSLPYALYDYASPRHANPGILNYLSEHGKLLLGPSAVRELKKLFGGPD